MQYIEGNKKKQNGKQEKRQSEELSALIKVASFERKQSKGKLRKLKIQTLYWGNWTEIEQSKWYKEKKKEHCTKEIKQNKPKQEKQNKPRRNKKKERKNCIIEMKIG